VRNLPGRGRRSLPQIEAHIEKELVFPLLRGRDLWRWGADPGAHILMVQDATARRGHPVDWLQQHYPQAYAYLKSFEPVLRDRSAYKRYFRPHDPFYSMFNVGRYTLDPVKVVWQGIGRDRMQAAVITTRGDKPILTNQAMHPFIGLQDETEAHYLAACLNSVPFEYAVLSHTQPGGKSFAQPGILKLLNLPRYQADNRVHREMAALSRAAHAGSPDDDAIARTAAAVWDLSAAEVDDLRISLNDLRN
jgi:hypothetical protein